MMEDVNCLYCASLCRVYWQETAVWHCPNCDLLFRYPQPDSQTIQHYYEAGWQPEQSVFSGATDHALAEIYKQRLLNLLRLPDFEGFSLLDFGAGQGAMLSELAESGAHVMGVEPYGFDFLQTQCMDVYSNLDDLPNDIQFDGIVTIQVVEHLTHPWCTVQELYSRLKVGGWLYISTIHAGSLNARLTRANWREACNPGHLFFFTPQNMVRLLEDAGYGRIQRINDFIRYPNRTRWQIGQDYMMQRLGLGGELCYLAQKF